jgi:hypothetical protein
VASQGMTTFRKMQWASQQHGPVWRNVPMAVTQLERSLRAWERFFATGDVEAADIRDEILRSWKRCYEAGLDPRAPDVPLNWPWAALIAVWTSPAAELMLSLRAN